MRPLSELVLDRLPGSRSLWIAVWTLVPAGNAGANIVLDLGGRRAVWEESHVLVVLNYVALSFAVFITLRGGSRRGRSCFA